MSEQKITPSQVTKPIQLLAAWLVGLILTNSAFLGAANLISKPDWAPGLLVIASVINVPAFLFLIFYLQTKFRAELQEDTYYSKHLEAVTGQVKVTAVSGAGLYDEFSEAQIAHKLQFESITEALKLLNARVDDIASNEEGRGGSLSKTAKSKSLSEGTKLTERLGLRIGINALIPGFKEITKELIEKKFNVVQYFGTNKDSAPPRYLTLSFSPDISKEDLKSIYKIIEPHGFNYIDFDDKSGVVEKSNVWIGSYVEPHGSVRASVIIDKSVEEMVLNDDVEIEQLMTYIRGLRSLPRD